jgi:hypothetical protein
VHTDANELLFGQWREKGVAEVMQSGRIRRRNKTLEMLFCLLASGLRRDAALSDATGDSSAIDVIHLTLILAPPARERESGDVGTAVFLLVYLFKH